jgi:hypothetical protein
MRVLGDDVPGCSWNSFIVRVLGDDVPVCS